MRPIEEIRSNKKLSWFKKLPPGIEGGGYINLSSGVRASFVMGTHEGEDGHSEHVSIELYARRLPTWYEMCEVKDIFWDYEEEVIQIHPKKSDYVNMTEALHLWRAADEDWTKLMRIR